MSSGRVTARNKQYPLTTEPRRKQSELRGITDFLEGPESRVVVPIQQRALSLGNPHHEQIVFQVAADGNRADCRGRFNSAGPISNRRDSRRGAAIEGHASRRKKPVRGRLRRYHHGQDSCLLR